MGTAVLPARDFLAHYQSHPNVDFIGFFYPKKSQQHPPSKKKSGHGHGFSSQKAKVKGENPEKKQSMKPKLQEESFPVVGKRFVNRIHKASDRKFDHAHDQSLKKQPAKSSLLMGQVTILKRGHALKPNNNSLSQLEIAKETTGQLFVSPAEFMRPDPTFLSQDRTMKSRSVSSKESKAAPLRRLETETAGGGNGIKTPNFPVFISEKWAGPAFANSPSPRSLPLPSFSIKKSGEESAEIDRFATRDLRRLLGLD
jgi:hypothetical protein